LDQEVAVALIINFTVTVSTIKTLLNSKGE
jgi:hypothetical protein